MCVCVCVYVCVFFYIVGPLDLMDHNTSENVYVHLEHSNVLNQRVLLGLFIRCAC